MKWEKSINFLVKILENPDLSFGYELLRSYYESNNMNYEADCLNYLIQQKFKNANSTDNS